jgi:alkanesulfonate monooxygenase SsuD/methylene tetrahydromethanopterin reductase-like flavin-dependent oxidoreductase (luciferase family)
MANRNSQDDARLESYAATNPLFNSRKLKLGSFGSNVEGGCAVTTADGALAGDWKSTVEVARLADEMEFEAIVPLGRYRGFGGETDYGGTSFEVYTWAAGVASATTYPAVFATSHVPIVSPVLAAKQAATIDHISGGRFALNIVTGWHKTEMEMFGATMLDHDSRYDAAAEWIEIIQHLWERDEPLNYEGKFFRATDALLKPRPVQRPRPPVMCAGQSAKGIDFAARYCEIGFIAFEKAGDAALMKAAVDRFKDAAWRDHRRSISLWSLAYIVQGDTEREARQLYDYYVKQHGDFVAAKNVITINGAHAQTWSDEVLQARLEDTVAGFGSYPLIGTPEQIVEGLQMLSDSGLDGVVLSWPNYRQGMEDFRDKVLPLLVQAGLR